MPDISRAGTASAKTALASVLVALLVLCASALAAQEAPEGVNAPPAQAAPAGVRDPAVRETSDAARPSGTEAPAKVTLRAAQILHPGHPIAKGLGYMAQLVRDRSGGRIALDIRPSAHFTGERELIERTQMGEIDLIVTSTAPLYGFTSDFLAFDLPYLFDDAITARSVLDGPFGEMTLLKAEGAGLVGLAYFENGLRHMTTAAKPVSVPGDLKGLKIRTMESRFDMEVFRTLGADPVPLAFRDLYDTLKAGTVDGQENPLPVIVTSRLFEVQNNLTLTGHFYLPAPMFISAGVWNKLPDGDRALIRAASRDAMHYHRALTDGFEGPETLSTLKSSMEVNESPDRALWKSALSPVRERFKSEIGEEILDELDREIARAVSRNAATPQGERRR
ncbi:MAG: DctP family TRAP transporter solute-binding subunit [Deltaproteobacteria bacterium]|jgi:tripartite ATP-independent transporter DctP family solute receptor|nr:DctP family TRAP transporter solute-binding subunit [Deltaproteobacteria bacterium]